MVAEWCGKGGHLPLGRGHSHHDISSFSIKLAASELAGELPRIFFRSVAAGLSRLLLGEESQLVQNGMCYAH